MTAFIGLGEFATKEVFDWIFNYPKIVKAVSIVGRLMDDLASHKVESHFWQIFFFVEFDINIEKENHKKKRKKKKRERELNCYPFLNNHYNFFEKLVSL